MKASRPALLPVALVATFVLAACTDAPSPAGVSPTDALAARGATAEHHHEVVMPVRDITRPGTDVVREPATADNAWRIAFPITYDIVLNHPIETRSGEDP